MGDMREVYDAMKDHSKEVKRNRYRESIELLQDEEIEFKVRTEGSYVTIMLDDKTRIDFYPSTGAWLHKGRNKKYGVGSLVDFIRKENG